MTILFVLFLALSAFGQLEGIPFGGGTVFLHELVLSFLVLSALPKLNIRKYAGILKAYGMFILIAVLSLVLNMPRYTSQEVLIGSLYLVRFACYAGLVFVIPQLLARKVPVFVYLFVTLSSYAVTGLVQLAIFPSLRGITYAGWDPHYFRLTGTLLDPNFAGIVICLAILIGFHVQKHFNRSVFIGIQIINGLALILTFSRSSYIACTVALMVLVFRIRKAYAVIPVILLAILIAVSQILPSDTLRLLRIDSSEARINNYIGALNLIAQSPVIGYGFNTLAYYTHSNGGASNIPQRTGAGIDNSILFVTAAAGIPGGFAYIAILIILIRTLWNLMKKNTYRYHIAAFITAVMVHSIFNNSLFYPFVMGVLFCVLGYGLADRDYLE